MGQTEPLLQRLAFWGDLSPEEKGQVEKNTAILHYEKGQLIHGGLNDCMGMALILEGEVRAYILSEEGREISLFRLYEGDQCVLSASCAVSQITFETQIVAERDCRLLTVHTDTLSSLSRSNIYVRCFVYEMMTERFSSVMWSMQQILFMGFDRRLAAFLVGELDRTGIPEIRMTHEQIAQHTSSAREVVARMLKVFSGDGLVEVRRGSIRLKSPEGLRRLV